MSRRERYGMIIGIGVAGTIAALVYSPAALQRGAGTRALVSAVAPAKVKEASLEGPGRVMAINVASIRVRECYRAEFEAAPQREQVVIVSFVAEIAEGQGVVSQGQVPSGDAVSMKFDRCVAEGLSRITFSTAAAPGRQRITFPFVYDLFGSAGEG